MDFHEVVSTTFAAREFTGEPLPDPTLFRILDRARFAPSGGNRQGWRVIVVRDPGTRDRLAKLTEPAARRYTAQVNAGESPWSSVAPTSVDPATIARTEPPARLIEPVLRAAVVLVVCVDLRVVAATDQLLPRVGIVAGASVYPFAWNILLAAREEGFGGTITTLAVSEEPRVKELLRIPPHVAVCAVMPLGRPVKPLTRLRRKPVPEFTMRERWDGAPFEA
jgi:nitroreductase